MLRNNHHGPQLNKYDHLIPRFLNFKHFFCKIWQNHMLAPTPWRVGTPPTLQGIQDLPLINTMSTDQIKEKFSGADPGFPVGRGANHPGGHQIILQHFVQNCMKLRKFWAVGEGGECRVHPLNLPLT